MAQLIFDKFFANVPTDVDVDSIWQQWQRLQTHYNVDDRQLPIPVWARRGFDHDRKAAWRHISQKIEAIEATRPFCIYIHIPFCARRCEFCDCYSFRLNKHRHEHIERYVALLAREMEAWSKLGPLARRPVSTVHFGGGTPTFLGDEALRMVVQKCRECFHTDYHTEWALETTTAEMSTAMFDTIDDLGFTRIHMGVQSLEDPVRALLNRQESSAEVLRKIELAVERGWVVSVDVIMGLPQQSLAGALQDLRTLSDNGVDGFSLYELQQSSRNRHFIQVHHLDRRPRLVNYLMLQTAAQYLQKLGYRKTLFNHFAGERDTNLYFNFPERGEDCLALGTIADGVFEDYHYRHPTYKAYTNADCPRIEGGVQRTRVENRLQLLFTALMAGKVSAELLTDVDLTIVSRWQHAGLFELISHADLYRLTGNGSWFVGNMILELVEQMGE